MDRLAEIVARSGEEARLCIVGKRQIARALCDARLLSDINLLQSFRHAVELEAKRFKLVTRSHVDALVELALADFPRASLDLADRSHHAAGDQQICRNRGNYPEHHQRA